ncbi:hypothetical protein AK812_SmicGene28133 [Symbiodinium microadriaticum]|uniref:Uncharacterized protein n=1 Tax=Symbiodinium microadriaticum TaxID=2951 RepID=A0A1Q9D537_SYMMI|nr:hypothetical protein AK812_SmicGene28133 [Symbiodinium microadriaticum]
MSNSDSDSAARSLGITPWAIYLELEFRIGLPGAAISVFSAATLWQEAISGATFTTFLNTSDLKMHVLPQALGRFAELHRRGESNVEGPDRVRRGSTVAEFATKDLVISMGAAIQACMQGLPEAQSILRNTFVSAAQWQLGLALLRLLQQTSLRANVIVYNEVISLCDAWLAGMRVMTRRAWSDARETELAWNDGTGAQDNPLTPDIDMMSMTVTLRDQFESSVRQAGAMGRFLAIAKGRAHVLRDSRDDEVAA